jgi:hypothetical protein
MKNIAAPYAAAPAQTPRPIPTEEGRTGAELLVEPPRGEPSPFGEEVEADELLSVAAAPPAMPEPAIMGMALLIIPMRVLTLGLGGL